ncbi:MAG: hypothetical protein E6I93_04395 [Chloroflexi bacterium]|nr:MAG: hypothetical protein E6I93_04395 [Chloroflexota bacterium]
MVVLAEIELPPIAFDTFIIVSVLFAVVGTLYLAYDLLGRQHGPLQWLTLIITCGLVSAFVLGSFGTILSLLLSHYFNLDITLQAMAVGGLMGVFTVVLVDFPKSQGKPRIVSPKGSAIGLAFGLLFFLTVLFVLRRDVRSALEVRTALSMGVTCAVLASLWPYLTWDSSPSRPHVFSRKGFVIGALLGLLFGSVFFFFASKDVVTSLLASIPIAFVCGGLIGLWRFIHWETSTPQHHIFSRKGFLVGFVIGFIPWLMFVITQLYDRFVGQHVTGLLDGLLVMTLILLQVIFVGALSLASAAAGSISRYILWKADLLPLRVLGVVGLVLILLATSLQAVPAIINLISILETPK